jgi:alpha-glucosidase
VGRDAVHAIYRAWRRIADSYGAGRVFVAEAVATRSQRLAHGSARTSWHTAFNFDFPEVALAAEALRTVIGRSLAVLRTVGAPATWVLSKHDETRRMTRVGRAHTGVRGPRYEGGRTD